MQVFGTETDAELQLGLLKSMQVCSQIMISIARTVDSVLKNENLCTEMPRLYTEMTCKNVISTYKYAVVNYAHETGSEANQGIEMMNLASKR